jgi:hypothetical protein
LFFPPYQVTHIRLSLDRCHQNDLNLYMQVGLVAVQCMGSLLDPAAASAIAAAAPASTHGSSKSASASASDDPALELRYDEATASLLRDIERQKA